MHRPFNRDGICHQPYPARPWTERKKLWRESSIAHIGNARTPTLVLHGEADHRYPLEQGEQLYTGLRVQGVEAVLVRYPGESHGFTRTGRRMLAGEKRNALPAFDRPQVRSLLL